MKYNDHFSWMSMTMQRATLVNFSPKIFVNLFGEWLDMCSLLIRYAIITFVVCIVAPVVMLIFWSGTSSKFIFCRKIARATIASSKANWSPTHLRGPPLKGMNLWVIIATSEYSWCWVVLINVIGLQVQRRVNVSEKREREAKRKRTKMCT